MTGSTVDESSRSELVITLEPKTVTLAMLSECSLCGYGFD